jgi:chloride channel protein, CIC family
VNPLAARLSVESPPLHPRSPIDLRVLKFSAIAVPLGLASAFVARWFVELLNLVTNLSFFGRFSAAPVSIADHRLGGFVVFVPVLGGVIVGLMARYGSKAIRGHGIPEAMEQVLTNQSRVPPRLLILKPLSAAVSIGTGGPFGAEGPIISTGGALGSLVGQLLETTADERKTLLAAGAAAGMTAIFGAPVSAVLLAIELLLFEFRPRSLIPISLASVSAMGMRLALFGGRPIFAMSDVVQPGGAALVAYVLIGAVTGVLAVGVTTLVYAIEDAFELLPIHWMWWPALGGIAVGVIGWLDPRTMGVGYDNIEHVLGGAIVGKALLALAALKFISWSISLGSGTSGGTLAPLFTIGGAFGAWLGGAAALAAPWAGVDPRVAALVGMASIFAGSSRALLASVVFAFETTRQPLGLLPLLGGSAAAYLLSYLFMRNTIMTEKISRRGIRVPDEVTADPMLRTLVGSVAHRTITVLRATDTVSAALEAMRSERSLAAHQGFPVVDSDEKLLGVITRRDLDLCPEPGRAVVALIKKAPVTVFEDDTLHRAIDLMLENKVGRLPVVARGEPKKVVGILTRSNVLTGYRVHLDERGKLQRNIEFAILMFRRAKAERDKSEPEG